MKFAKIFIVAIVALLGFSACGDPNNGGGGGSTSEWNDNGSPVGEWVLTEWNGSKDLPFGVYIRFNEDNTFELYQHTYTVLWVRYTGTFSLNGSTLTGVYSDGEKWNSYTIKYNGETKQIRLTNTEKNEESIYTSTTIPTEIVEDATEAVNVRSVEFDKFL